MYLENKKLLDKCNKYAKINEDITASLYTRFALAFNHLKGRLDSSAGVWFFLQLYLKI